MLLTVEHHFRIGGAIYIITALCSLITSSLLLNKIIYHDVPYDANPCEPLLPAWPAQDAGTLPRPRPPPVQVFPGLLNRDSPRPPPVQVYPGSLNRDEDRNYHSQFYSPIHKYFRKPPIHLRIIYRQPTGFFSGFLFPEEAGSESNARKEMISKAEKASSVDTATEKSIPADSSQDGKPSNTNTEAPSSKAKATNEANANVDATSVAPMSVETPAKPQAEIKATTGARSTDGKSRKKRDVNAPCTQNTCNFQSLNNEFEAHKGVSIAGIEIAVVQILSACMCFLATESMGRQLFKYWAWSNLVFVSGVILCLAVSIYYQTCTANSAVGYYWVAFCIMSSVNIGSVAVLLAYLWLIVDTRLPKEDGPTLSEISLFRQVRNRNKPRSDNMYT